jgi:hypothetical protein
MMAKIEQGDHVNTRSVTKNQGGKGHHTYNSNNGRLDRLVTS